MDDATNWQRWHGGACPVPADTIITVRRRYGPPATARAGDLRWSHDLYVAYGADDILAYAPMPGFPPSVG